METHIYGNSHVWKLPYDSCIRCFETGEYMNMPYKRSDVLMYSPL